MAIPSLDRQTLDALGRPLHDLRISVIDACNLRCTYCMPAEEYHERYRFLESSERLSFDEIERLARCFAELGVSKLRLTGGEPLLRKDLPELVARLAAIEGIEDLALTTNGLQLARHAAALKEAGLRRVTVSLDSLDDGVFQRMSGKRASVASVLEGIAAAADAGLDPIKINVVVQKGVNDHTVLGLVEHFRGTGCVLRFIEYMDVGNRNHWKREDVVSSADIVRLIHERWPIHPLEPNYRGEVAARYGFADGAGELGFISSITQPFCGDCHRARLSADGKLLTCLFAGSGKDLREPLRRGVADDELRAIIGEVWRGRRDRYSELRDRRTEADAPPRKIEMYQIGG
jgi:cyclic pyranopterin phosphate synthase